MTTGCLNKRDGLTWLINLSDEKKITKRCIEGLIIEHVHGCMAANAVHAMDLTDAYFVYIYHRISGLILGMVQTRSGMIYCMVLIIANHIHWQATWLPWVEPLLSGWHRRITFKYLTVVFCIWPSLHEVASRICPHSLPIPLPKASACASGIYGNTVSCEE